MQWKTFQVLYRANRPTITKKNKQTEIKMLWNANLIYSSIILLLNAILRVFCTSFRATYWWCWKKKILLSFWIGHWIGDIFKLEFVVHLTWVYVERLLNSGHPFWRKDLKSFKEIENTGHHQLLYANKHKYVHFRNSLWSCVMFSKTNFPFFSFEKKPNFSCQPQKQMPNSFGMRVSFEITIFLYLR